MPYGNQFDGFVVQVKHKRTSDVCINTPLSPSADDSSRGMFSCINNLDIFLMAA